MARYLLTGHLAVTLPPEQAFQLFTARGEERWVPGWSPRFPVAAADDTAPGTVFETTADGRTTTWLVVDREPGRMVRYARMTPEFSAGTVTVELADAGRSSDVTVSYDLTALSPAAEEFLDSFARGYQQMLDDWAAAIAASRHAD
jgi:hypothetical protein